MDAANAVSPIILPRSPSGTMILATVFKTGSMQVAPVKAANTANARGYSPVIHGAAIKLTAKMTAPALKTLIRPNRVVSQSNNTP